MLAIKLQRIGKQHQPSYRIVVQEKREKLNGPSVEDLGWLDPVANKSQVNAERVKHWISVGAQPTDTVHNLLVTLGVLSGKKRAVHRVKKEALAAEAPKAVAATPAAEAAPETPATT